VKLHARAALHLGKHPSTPKGRGGGALQIHCERFDKEKDLWLGQKYESCTVQLLH